MSLFLKKLFLVIGVCLGLVNFSAFSQENKLDDKKNKENQQKQPKGKNSQNFTAEQVVESTILFYGSRERLKQIRATTEELGKSNVVNPDGQTELVEYQRRILRGDSLFKDKIRVEEKRPSGEISLVFNTKVFGIIDQTVFTPRKDIIDHFMSQFTHNLESLLRYKENESKIELSAKEKRLGAEYYPVTVTDKENNVTKFFISVNLIRVMWLEYTKNGVNYRRTFHDYRIAQGTLYPYRTVLYADGKQIEETNVGTIRFGQKIEAALFAEN